MRGGLLCSYRQMVACGELFPDLLHPQVRLSVTLPLVGASGGAGGVAVCWRSYRGPSHVLSTSHTASSFQKDSQAEVLVAFMTQPLSSRIPSLNLLHCTGEAQ